MQGHLKEDIDADVSVDVVHLLFHDNAERTQQGNLLVLILINVENRTSG